MVIESLRAKGETKMKLYHGSHNDFNQFNFKHLGKNGKAQGSGIYLTTNPQFAKGYGDILYAVDIVKGKALSLDKITISRTTLKKIILDLHDTVDYLNNINDVSYYGVAKVLNDTLKLQLEYNTNDVDIYNSIVNEAGDLLEVCKAFKKHGYNFIQQEHVVVALDPGDITILEKTGE